MTFYIFFLTVRYISFCEIQAAVYLGLSMSAPLADTAILNSVTVGTKTAMNDQPCVDALASAAQAIDLEARQEETATTNTLTSAAASGKRAVMPPSQGQRLEFTDEQKRFLLQHKMWAKAANKRVSWKKLSKSELLQGYTKMRL
jgi:hypothetical protein